MKRYSLLALGLALTLPCASSRAIDQPAAVGTDNQTGAANANQQPATAPTSPQPDVAQPLPPPGNAPAAQQPDAGQTKQQPNNGQANQQPNSAQPNQQPNDAQPNQQPNDAPANVQPDTGQQNQQPGNGPATQQPGTGQTDATGTAQQGAMAASNGYSPLQQFVSHQVDEVAMLSPQFDAFRAANRQDAVRVLYHMVRDHVLVADAARNLLARRGQVSRPVSMSMPMTMTAMGDSPEQIIRQDIEAHQQALSSTQQLLANATSPEERSIYQQAINGTQKHLSWLQSMDQGQQVAVGFFQPTIPLSRIAGYREQVAAAGGSGQQMRRSRRVGFRHGTRSRRHYYRGTGRYR